MLPPVSEGSDLFLSLPRDVTKIILSLCQPHELALLARTSTKMQPIAEEEIKTYKVALIAFLKIMFDEVHHLYPIKEHDYVLLAKISTALRDKHLFNKLFPGTDLSKKNSHAAEIRYKFKRNEDLFGQIKYRLQALAGHRDTLTFMRHPPRLLNKQTLYALSKLPFMHSLFYVNQHNYINKLESLTGESSVKKIIFTREVFQHENFTDILRVLAPQMDVEEITICHDYTCMRDERNLPPIETIVSLLKLFDCLVVFSFASIGMTDDDMPAIIDFIKFCSTTGIEVGILYQNLFSESSIKLLADVLRETPSFFLEFRVANTRIVSKGLVFLEELPNCSVVKMGLLL